MEIIFVSGMPCSGKSVLTKALVKALGNNRAARLPGDHYFLDATCPEHKDQSHMSVYQRDRVDWDILFSHLSELQNGNSIHTPRYDWESSKRVSRDLEIGRTARVSPCEILFVDGMHPSLDESHKHIFVCQPTEIRNRLCRIRAEQMPVPEHYEDILKEVETSLYRNALEWLDAHAWQKVSDPLTLNIEEFCQECGWVEQRND